MKLTNFPRVRITHGPTPHLDGQYTVFGQIRSGEEIIDQIEQGDLITSARLVE